LPNMLAFDLPGVPGVGRRVPAHKLNAASGVGRRVESSGLPAIAMAACDFRAMTSRRWQAGEAGGHLFVIFSACKPNGIPN